MLRVIFCVLYMIGLIPLRSEADRLFRWQLAVAITRGTEDEDEQRVLMRLGWLEGWFSRDVASCRIKGTQGEHGLFQIKPRNAEEKRAACGTLDAQVALALVFVRRSRELCAHLEPRDQLSLYTTGKCQNNREARNRWGD